MATKTTVSAKDAKILDMVFNPEGTMLPDKETENMLNSEPIGKQSRASLAAHSSLLPLSHHHQSPHLSLSLPFMFNPTVKPWTLTSSLSWCFLSSITDKIVIEPEMLKKLKSLESEAILLAEKDDIDGAIAKFSEAITLCPNYASAYNNRYLSFQRCCVFRKDKDQRRQLRGISQLLLAPPLFF